MSYAAPFRNGLRHDPTGAIQDDVQPSLFKELHCGRGIISDNVWDSDGIVAVGISLYFS